MRCFTKRDYPEIRKILQLLFKLWFGVSQWVVRVAISHATAVDSKSRGVANARILIQSVEDLASAKLTPMGTCHVFGWGEKVVAGKVISRSPTMPADLILHATSIPHAIPAQDLGIRCVNVSHQPNVNVNVLKPPTDANGAMPIAIDCEDQGDAFHGLAVHVEARP